MVDDPHAAPLGPVRSRRRPGVEPRAADTMAVQEQQRESELPGANSAAPRTASPQSGVRGASKEPDYDIGYGKPPRHSQFKPGQSGNPRGRPKRALGLNTIIRKRMLTSVQIKTARGIERVPIVEALLLKALDSGSRGEFRAIEKLLAMYAAAVPELAEVSEGPPQADAEALSKTDEEILKQLRATVAAELQLPESKAGTHERDGGDGDA